MTQRGCPVLLALASQDQLTSAKLAQSLIEAAHRHEKSARVVQLPLGHNQMTEAPEPLLAAWTGLLLSPSQLHQKW